MHAWLCRQCCVCQHHKGPATECKNLAEAFQTVNRRNNQIQAQQLDDTWGSARKEIRTTFQMRKVTLSHEYPNTYQMFDSHLGCLQMLMLMQCMGNV